MWCILNYFSAVLQRRGLQKLIKCPTTLFLCSYLYMLYNEFFHLHILFLLTGQISLNNHIAPGNRLFGYIYLYGEKNFQESFNWACSLSGCQNCQWPKAIRTLCLFKLAVRQMTEPTWQSLEAEKWKKRAYLALRSNHRLLKWGGGWTGRGVLMSLKMFLNITLI